jgi:hypothetical protein
VTHVTMRAIECECGEHVDARTDTALLDAFRDHCLAEHPNWSEADIKAHFTRNVYDVPMEGRG